MKNRLLIFMLVVLSLITSSNEICSQDNPVYGFNWKADGYVFALDGLLLGSSLIIDHKQGLISESELDLLNPLNINSFDRSAIDRYNPTAAKYSDYCRDFAFIMPLAFLAGQKGRAEWKTISLLYLETLLTNTALTSFTKVAVGRRRPYTYNTALSLEQRQTTKSERSFYSGHVSHVSSLSFFAASILDDLYPKSKLKYVWWSVATVLPAATAYWRYDGGRHFPSDVIVGYIVGGAIGYLIPKFHKINSDKFNVSIIPTMNTLSLGLTINLD